MLGKQLAGVAPEAPGAGIGVGELIKALLRIGLLIEGFFENDALMDTFVKDCDVIVHLAAMNRHQNEQVIYDTNMALTSHLITSCKRSNANPHIIFSSSTQESQDNLYGKSKKESKGLLEKWALNSEGQFTSLTIPNVF